MDWIKVNDKVLVIKDIPEVARTRKYGTSNQFTNRIGIVKFNGRRHVELVFSDDPLDILFIHRNDFDEVARIVNCLNNCPKCQYRFLCFTQR